MPPAEAWVRSVKRWPGGRELGGSRLSRDGRGLLEGKVAARHRLFISGRLSQAQHLPVGVSGTVDSF